MPSGSTIIVATSFKPLVSLLHTASHGSDFAVTEITTSDDVVKAISSRNTPVVVSYGPKGQLDWLEFVKDLKTKCPQVRIIVFGESVDLAIVAKSIVAGVHHYVPMSSFPSSRDVRAILDNAVAGKQIPAETLYARVDSMLPRVSGNAGRYRSSSGTSFDREQAIQKCTSLGLTAEETRDFLDVTDKDVSNADKKLARRSPAGPRIPVGSLLVAGVLLAGVLALLSLAGRKRGEPITGTVSFRGERVPSGLVELSNDATGMTHAAALEKDGTFIVQTHQPEGLPAGRYRVSIKPPRANVPSLEYQPVEKIPREDYTNIPEQYHDPGTSGISIDVAPTGRRHFDLKME